MKTPAHVTDNHINNYAKTVTDFVRRRFIKKKTSKTPDNLGSMVIVFTKIHPIKTHVFHIQKKEVRVFGIHHENIMRNVPFTKKI